MTVISFEFEFDGFSGKGSCILTIATTANNERPSVVCSQKRGYTGTSITNAVERIARRLYHEVALRELAIRDAQLNEVQANLRKFWRNTPRPPKLHTLYGRCGIQWIEHYPAGTGLTLTDSFREVLFNTQDSPIWRPMHNFAEAKERFGKELIESAFNFSRLDQVR